MGTKSEGRKRVIYPGRSIDVYLPIDRALPAGEYEAQVRYDYAPNKAAQGKLTLTVSEEDAKEGIGGQAGPFKSLTVGLSVTVAREFEEISVAPVGFRTGVLEVTNNEDTALLVATGATDVAMDPDGVLTPTGTPPNNLPGVAEWLQVGPEEFQLPPGKSRKVIYKVGPPKRDDMRSDLVGLIRFTARQLDMIARQAEEEVIGEAGTLLIASMAGQGKPGAELGVLQVDTRPEKEGIISFGVPIKCTGDIHFFPVVRLNIQGEGASPFQWERTLGAVADRMLVLPGMERVMWFDVVRETLPPGRYIATASVDYGVTEPATRGYTVDLHDMSTGAGQAEGTQDTAPTQAPTTPQPGTDAPAAPPGG